MELIFDLIINIIFATAMIFCVVYLRFVYKEIQDCKFLQKKIIHLQIESVDKQNDILRKCVKIEDVQIRSEVSFNKAIEATRPMKPNNWNSVQEAFKKVPYHL